MVYIYNCHHKGFSLFPHLSVFVPKYLFVLIDKRYLWNIWRNC